VKLPSPKRELTAAMSNKKGGAALCSYSDSAVGRKGGEILEPRPSNKSRFRLLRLQAPFGVRRWALDMASADRLCGICGEMTGVQLEASYAGKLVTAWNKGGGVSWR
jgi:hypothetical protein